MSDKKEVIDYLRNKQKAAEIESKVNGINLWVLMGAISIVLWQMIDVASPLMLTQRENALRVLMFSEAAYLFFWQCSPTRGVRNDLRYTSSGSVSADSPVLSIVEGLWLLVPSVLSFWLVGKSLSASILGLFGFMWVVSGVVALVSKFRGGSGDQERLPTPLLALTARSDIVGDLVFGAAYIFVIVDQVVEFSGQVNVLEKEAVKFFSLLAVLYVLIVIAIRRKRASHSINWTYELETDLLVGSVSPEVAIRRIENLALGPRLQDVVDRFLDEVDNRFAAFDKSMEKFGEALAVVSDIPKDYPSERTARIKEASALPQENLEKLKKDVTALSEYIKKLGMRKSDVRVVAVLESLAARSKVYETRIRTAKADFDALMRRHAG